MLPKRIPKARKRASRWRSRAHCDFVRGHACCNCGSMSGVQVAHVRIGSGAGMGQKPDDWNTVSLCHLCHDIQHKAERTFWDKYAKEHGCTVWQLMEAYCRASPRAREIAELKRERDL